MAESFRFLHTSNLHLDRPVGGLVEVPQHLKHVLIDAPLRAAEQVFDAAIIENVDFVLLCGDVLQPQLAGPRVISFLLDQLERLQQEEIAVYWIGGEDDQQQQWPESVPLPSCVYRFPHRIEEVSHFRGESAIATLIGQSYNGRRQVRPADFRSDSPGAYAIGLAYGEIEPTSLNGIATIDYWALGGRRPRKVLSIEANAVAQFPGAPQGRQPEEAGQHGCTVVEVSEEGTTRTQMIPTDVVRWRDETISLQPDADEDDLRKQLQDRVQAIVTDAGDRPVLVDWTIQCGGGLAAQLRGEKLAAETVEWLRKKYGHHAQAVWTGSLTIGLPDRLPTHWYEEDTIRGDFLRAARRIQQQEESILDLSSLLSEKHQAGTLSAAADMHYIDSPDRILREAAVLGADLLGGGRDA